VSVKNNFLYFLLFVGICSNSLVNAQQTYSKVYDLEVGVNNIAQYFFLEENSFIVATTHAADAKIKSALTRLNYDGLIINQNSYSDFVFGRSRSVVNTTEGFEIAGHRWTQDSTGARGLELIKVNNELDFEEQILMNYEKSRVTNLPGILSLNDSLKVVYGSFIPAVPGGDGGAYFVLMDKATDSIYSEVILRESADSVYVYLNIYDLQETSDGNMLYIAETRIRSSTSPTGKSSEFEVVKFNWEGEILNRIVAPRSVNRNQAIAQDDEGSVYFYNILTPFFIDSTVAFPDRRGGLIKLNERLDSVLWSFQIFEKDGIDLDRGHTILGIKQTKDKHLLAFGGVGFNVNGDNESVGFICKFTKEGEILWVREYGIPIPEEYVDLSLVGVLGNAFIRDCKEMEDGRLLCMGQNTYEKTDQPFYNELWILMLDENGCLEPDCEATNILSSTSTAVSLQAGTIYPNPVSDILYVTDVSYDQYKIHDLMGRLVQQGEFTAEIALSEQLSSGMYVLQLKEDGRLISVFKFMRSVE